MTPGEYEREVRRVEAGEPWPGRVLHVKHPPSRLFGYVRPGDAQAPVVYSRTERPTPLASYASARQLVDDGWLID